MMMQRSGDWDAIPAVSYTLAKNELAPKFAAGASGNEQRYRLIQGINAVLVIGTGIARLTTPLGFRWFGVAQIVLGLMLALSAYDPRFRWLRRKRDLSVRFGDAGITIDGTTPKTIPWRAVRSVSDDGDLLLFDCGGLSRRLIVPKRVFADRGAALWTILEALLIGRRLLQRRPDSRTIVNTALTA